MKVHGATARIRRLELGLSLDDVARTAGIDKSNLSKLERGVLRGAHPGTARKLAMVLDMPMDELAPDLATLKAEQP